MVLERDEAMVGDGDAMGIAGQVVENMFSTAEGWLGVNDPVLSAELPEEMVESRRMRQAVAVSCGTGVCPVGTVHGVRRRTCRGRIRAQDLGIRVNTLEHEIWIDFPGAQITMLYR
jgi:hypothetical protein